MTEQKNALAQLFAAGWSDETLKARFMAYLKAVLKEHGLNVPDGIDVKRSSTSQAAVADRSCL